MVRCAPAAGPERVSDAVIDHDELVAILMMADDAGDDPEYVLKNQRSIVAHVRAGAVHDGDCTKRAHTCFRCLVERYDESAHAAMPFIVRALASPEKAAPTPPMSEAKAEAASEQREHDAELMARATQAVLAIIGVDDRVGPSAMQAVVSPATHRLAAEIARAVIDAIPESAPARSATGRDVEDA